jgi:hypothetical protein
MSRFFRWCMSYGAAILFVLALFQLVAGLVPSLTTLMTETGRMAQNYDYAPVGSNFQLAMQLQVLLASISGAAFPFFGALLIDRMDRWLTLKATETRQ